AAQVDGATPWQAFRKAIVPLAAPGVFTTALIAFFIAWNDFVYGISLTSTSAARPVPAALAFFTGASYFEEPTGAISAAAVVVTIPVVVLVVLFQRQIVSGLTQGAVKGRARRPGPDPPPTARRPAPPRPEHAEPEERADGVDHPQGHRQALRRRVPRGRPREPRHRRRRVRHPRRAVRLGEVDGPAHDRGARGHRVRRPRDRRRAGQREGAARARPRDGVPELRAVPAPHGRGEHRVPAAARQGQAQRGG